MFEHFHPYPPFIPDNCKKLIVGTLPPPRFTTGELKVGDVNFCYGSRDGQLWPILDQMFSLQLNYENTVESITERKNFLINHSIGVCDIVAKAKRAKIDASDLGMQHVELRDIISILEKYPSVKWLLFTGGNSKNGPEYFFRKLIKETSIVLKVISSEVPRVHQFTLPISGRKISTVSLTAPSGAANRAVGSLEAYKKMKAENPTLNTIDFRIRQYMPFFKG